MRSLLRALTDTGRVLGTSARLLARHWPTLIAITIFGYAAREGLLWLATKASETSSALGSMVFALLPIAILSSYILTFLVIRQSLPGIIAGPKVKGRLLGDVGSALVPFIVIYASYGDLERDFGDYVYDILTDSFGVSGGVQDRMPFELTRMMLIVAGCAFAVRTILDWWQRSQKFLLIGFLKAYLDVISIVVIWVTIVKPGLDWIWDRKAANAVEDLMSPVQSVWGNAIDALEPVIILPVAWLVVAAVVYGDQLRDLPTPAEFRTYRRMSVLPKRVRTAVLGIANPGGRFGALILAVRVLRRANLPLIMLYCLAFVVVREVPNGLWELERLIVGPQDLTAVWFSLSSVLAGLNSALGSTVLICLVAAAAEHFLVAQRAAAQPVGPVVEAEPPALVRAG